MEKREKQEHDRKLDNEKEGFPLSALYIMVDVLKIFHKNRKGKSGKNNKKGK